jgi:replicative DNA helicase
MSDELILPHNLEFEQGVLGAMLTSKTAVEAVIGGTLKPQHFYRKRHGLIFTAIGRLDDRGEPVDAATVERELLEMGELDHAGGRETLIAVGNTSPPPGSAAAYAGHIVRDADWRAVLEASQAITAAAWKRDESALANAEAMLNRREGDADREYDSDRQAEVLYRIAEHGLVKDGLEWPFPELTRACAIRPGSLNVLSAYTSTGKSVFCDQMLDHWHFAGKDLNVGLLWNETTVEERQLRRASRRTEISRARLERGELQPPEHGALIKEIAIPTWDMTDMIGWDAEHVARYIRRWGKDAVVVDLLNRFPFDGSRALEPQIGDVINRLADAAALSKTAVILVAQVNRQSAGMVAQRRKPNIFDLKGSGDIETHSDTVTFIYRPRDADDEMLDEGEIYFDKTRHGGLSSVDVEFDWKNMRFDRRQAEPVAAGYAAESDEGMAF